MRNYPHTRHSTRCGKITCHPCSGFSPYKPNIEGGGLLCSKIPNFRPRIWYFCVNEPVFGIYGQNSSNKGGKLFLFWIFYIYLFIIELLKSHQCSKLIPLQIPGIFHLGFGSLLFFFIILL